MQDIQLDLFLDYASNLALYPVFQEFIREFSSRRRWQYGASTIRSSFRRERRLTRSDNPNATVTMLDTGHFALETHVEEIAEAIDALMERAKA